VRAIAANGKNERSRCGNAEDSVPAEMVNCVVAAEPEGVTVAGLKEQVAPAGRPEQAKLTAELNPFCGVTVRVTLPLVSAVSEAADAARVKLGDRVMVYVADAMALFLSPVADAIACSVSVEPTVMGALYAAEEALGVLPSVV
jgi:hypothetical protein